MKIRQYFFIRTVGQGGVDDVVTIDIGGTSADITLISKRKPMIRQEGIVGDFAVRVAMVDVNTIGSGGGSIARIEGGSLRVGPQSAGSEPGPACYGRGGEDATVCDASVVLGYLDPDYFAGGSFRLKSDLAHTVIREQVAKPMGLSLERAALGVHRVLNAQMAEGIRLVSMRQGIDPRAFALIPLGGAVATAFDAYVKPVVGLYLEQLEIGAGRAETAGTLAGDAIPRRTYRLAGGAPEAHPPLPVGPSRWGRRREDCRRFRYGRHPYAAR